MIQDPLYFLLIPGLTNSPGIRTSCPEIPEAPAQSSRNQPGL